MLRKIMIVLATTAALTGGLTAEAFARGGGGHGGGGGGHMGGGFGGARMGGGFGVGHFGNGAIGRGFAGQHFNRRFGRGFTFGPGWDYGCGYGYPYYNPYSCYLPTYWLPTYWTPSASAAVRRNERSSRPDSPSLRRLTTCPLCGGDKPRGLLVCFGCYRKHDMRNGNPAIERLLAGLVEWDSGITDEGSPPMAPIPVASIMPNARDSTSGWPPAVAAAAGALNALLILTDGVGFGAPSAFGGV
jgi:hypothetical protein